MTEPTGSAAARLRTALDQLARSVPPSENPRAELDRRLAARRGRAVLVAAAAAAVVAAVVVPVSLGHESGPSTTRPAATVPEGVGTVPAREVGRYTENGTDVVVELILQSDTTWCLNKRVAGATVPPEEMCDRAPEWATAPPGERYATTRQVWGDGAPNSGPLPNQLLFLVKPPYDVVVRDGQGRPVAVYPLGATRGVRFFVAEFPDGYAGFGYTVLSEEGEPVVEGIS